MAYTKQTWTNGSAGGTPLSAARLQHLEDGLEDAANVADAAGTGDVAGDTHAATGKGTPVDADEFPIVDSANANLLGKVTFASLKAWVKSWIAKTDVGLSNVTNNAQYFAGGADVALADGGTGASLADPNADRLMFWDDSVGAMAFLTPGTGLTITGTTIDASGGGGGDASTNTSTSIVSEIALFADTAGKTLKRATGSGLAKLTSGVLGTATAGTDYVAPGGALGTPSAGTLTSCTGLPVSGIAASTATALGVGSLELGHASDTTLSRSSAGVLAVEGVAIPTISSTHTYTNKRVTPRVGSTTSSATPTINTDSVDIYGLTALAVDITSFTTNLSGTPTDGQQLLIYIVGTATRAITWGASFENGAQALPAATVSTARLDVAFVWNAASSKWRCMGSTSLANRVTTITSSGTPTINTDLCDAVTITALAAAITSMTTNLTGTPTNFQRLIIRIKDNGTARAISWGASFEDGSVALPTTTVLGKTLLVGLVYDAVDAKWACEATGSRA